MLHELASTITLLVVLGVVLYLIKTYLPIDNAIKVIITVVVVLAACIYLLQLIGIL